MDKPSVLKRKEYLESEKANVLAQLNAINGGLYECDFWLIEIEKAEMVKSEAKKKAEKAKDKVVKLPKKKIATVVDPPPTPDPFTLPDNEVANE